MLAHLSAHARMAVNANKPYILEFIARWDTAIGDEALLESLRAEWLAFCDRNDLPYIGPDAIFPEEQ